MEVEVTPWSELELIEPATEGFRNEVWKGRIERSHVSIRKSRRPYPSLEWELELMERLDALGFRVPRVVPTDDGALHSRGVVVQTWLEGRPPASDEDWESVSSVLTRLHSETRNYRQRPGCCVMSELAEKRRSVDADLDRMPSSARRQVTAVFATLADLPTSVVHGDPGESNIRISPTGEVGLLDWDESRYDTSLLDLASLGVQVLDDMQQHRAERILHAWEAANGWVQEPEYARRQLEFLMAD